MVSNLCWVPSRTEVGKKVKMVRWVIGTPFESVRQTFKIVWIPLAPRFECFTHIRIPLSNPLIDSRPEKTSKLYQRSEIARECKKHIIQPNVTFFPKRSARVSTGSNSPGMMTKQKLRQSEIDCVVLRLELVSVIGLGHGIRDCYILFFIAGQAGVKTDISSKIEPFFLADLS